MNRSAVPPLAAIARIERIENTVLASGTIQPLKLVNVGAQASGRIVHLHVTLGAHIVRGEVVAEIDPSTQRNSLENAQAVLDQERAQRSSRTAALKQSELAFRRAAETFAQEASSQADYEAAEATYEARRPI